MASEIVVTCVDSRMEAVLPKILPTLGIKTGGYHRVTAFGGSLGLDHEFELCELIVDNLKADRVNVFDHVDCKAYRKKFGDLDQKAEEDWHVERLKRVGNMLRQEYPNLQEARLFLLSKATPEEIFPEVVRVS